MDEKRWNKTSHLAKRLEDSNEDLLGGSVWKLAFPFAEPAAGQSLQVDGVRTLSRQGLIHVFGVAEERVPVVARGEVHLVLDRAHLMGGGAEQGDLSPCRRLCMLAINEAVINATPF